MDPSVHHNKILKIIINQQDLNGPFAPIRRNAYGQEKGRRSERSGGPLFRR